MGGSDAGSQRQEAVGPVAEGSESADGRQLRQATADNGYFSEPTVTDAQLQEIDRLVAPDRQKHGKMRPTTTGPRPSGASVAEQMRHKLRTVKGQAVYTLRKAVVGPVFGQIKEAGIPEIPAARAGKSAGGMADDLGHPHSA